MVWNTCFCIPDMRSATGLEHIPFILLFIAPFITLLGIPLYFLVRITLDFILVFCAYVRSKL